MNYFPPFVMYENELIQVHNELKTTMNFCPSKMQTFLEKYSPWPISQDNAFFIQEAGEKVISSHQLYMLRTVRLYSILN